MSTSQKITQKITLPQGLTEALRVSMAGLAGLRAEIEKRMAEKDVTVTQIVEMILAGSIALDGSDIHIEGQENDAKLRIRLDGVLQDVMVFDKKTYESLVNRVKLLSEMKLNIANKPQDGRFSILAGDDSVEIRASILPTEYGDSIVMRILNPKSLISLDQAGLRKDLYDIFLQQINRPNGMIIVTGPTGSGKTTTLYAFLKQIQNSEIKIITIEDRSNTIWKGFPKPKSNLTKGMILFPVCAPLSAKIRTSFLSVKSAILKLPTSRSRPPLLATWSFRRSTPMMPPARLPV